MNAISRKILILFILNLGLVSCGPDKKDQPVQELKDEWESDLNFQYENKSIHEFKDLGDLPVNLKIVFSEKDLTLINRVSGDSECLSDPDPKVFRNQFDLEPSQTLDLAELLPWEVLIPSLNPTTYSCKFSISLTNFNGSKITYEVSQKSVTQLADFFSYQPFTSEIVFPRQDFLISTLNALELNATGKEKLELACADFRATLGQHRPKKQFKNFFKESTAKLFSKQPCRIFKHEVEGRKLSSPIFFMHQQTQPLQLTGASSYIADTEAASFTDKDVLTYEFRNLNDQDVLVSFRFPSASYMEARPLFVHYPLQKTHAFGQNYFSLIKWQVEGAAKIVEMNAAELQVVVKKDSQFKLIGKATQKFDCSRYGSRIKFPNLANLCQNNFVLKGITTHYAGLPFVYQNKYSSNSMIEWTATMSLEKVSQTDAGPYLRHSQWWSFGNFGKCDSHDGLFTPPNYSHTIYCD